MHDVGQARLETGTTPAGTDVANASCDQVAADLRLALLEAEHKIENLERALETGRLIGMAVGILIERHRITKEQAFELLATVSQQRQTKVRVLADEMLFTGLIAEPEVVAAILNSTA